MEILKTGNILPTKTEVTKVVSEIIQPVLDGEVDPLNIQLKLSFIEKVIKEIKAHKKFKDLSFDEIGKYGKNTEIQGAKIEQSQSVQYQFPDEVVEFKQELENHIKAIQDLSKKVPAGTAAEYIHPITGEVIKVGCAIKKSTDIIKITLSK
jgi:hypothetical protein